jgi:EpsD family peptidyl-prolyl cis-trans isomerase
VALRNIIARKILAKAARDQGIDKTADFALLQQRAAETLLTEALENKLAASVPAPSTEEVARFISDHPELFAQRRLLEVDQITAARPNDQNVMKELAPLNTLEDIAALLTREHIEFRRGAGELDTARMGPQMTAAILKLPPNEVFVVPNGNLILVNQVRDSKVVPLGGDEANKIATQYLKTEHSRDAITKAVNELLAKASPTVRYNPAYQPQKPAPSPQGAKPAPAANGAKL